MNLRERYYKEFEAKYANDVSRNSIELWTGLVTNFEGYTDVKEMVDNLEDHLKNQSIKINKDLMKEKGKVGKNAEGEIEIKINLTSNNYIQRFTMVHELAHILFEREHIEEGKSFESNYASPEILNDKIEIRANGFAAELLLPAELIIEYTEEFMEQGGGRLSTLISKISEDMELSPSMVENRMKNVGVIK